MKRITPTWSNEELTIAGLAERILEWADDAQVDLLSALDLTDAEFNYLKSLVPPKTYTVTVSNVFEASSPRDAVVQMIEYMSADSRIAGYRIDESGGPSFWIDAETMDQADLTW